MHYIGYIFPFFFIGMWVLMTFIFSKLGWGNLVASYACTEKFSGTRVGIISAGINGISYNNALVLKYNEEGIYLVPIWVFRMFHKPILIPWKAISAVRDKKLFFFEIKELVIGDPFVAIIALRKSTFEKIATAYVKKIPA